MNTKINFEMAKKYGIAIDTIMAIVISIATLILVSEITKNSFYTLAIVSYTMILLLCAFASIEWFYGPIIIQFLYKAELKKEKERIKIYSKLPINLQ